MEKKKLHLRLFHTGLHCLLLMAVRGLCCGAEYPNRPNAAASASPRRLLVHVALRANSCSALSLHLLYIFPTDAGSAVVAHDDADDADDTVDDQYLS